MRKTMLAILAVLALAMLAWAGGEPWKRPFTDWNAKDVAEVQQNSPWAKTAQGQGAWRPDGVTQASGAGGVAGSGTDRTNASAGATPDKAGGMEKAAASGPVTYSVWWWSSRTIRAASLRDAVLKGKMTQPDAEKSLAQPVDEYEMLVRGTNMYTFQQRGEKAFETASYIQLKKTKQKIAPSHVSFLKGPDGASVIGAVFFFPKKGANGEPTISPDEKEIDFYVQVGDQKLVTYFEPKKMVDSQGEDL